MLISVIIPVYNVERYLSKCLDSILEQTYQEIEIILIDDGSPDKSGQICDQYAASDKRIKVFHVKNGGAASARNIGLSKAKGDYVLFVDGDDFWMGSTSLQELVNIVNDKPYLDFIGFNCSYYYTKYNRYKRWVDYKASIVNETNKNILVSELIKCGMFPMSPCLKIIKRQFLIEEAILFPEGTIAEDIPWFIDILDKSNAYIFVNLYLYAYRQDNEQSVTHTFNSHKFENLFEIVCKELNCLKERTFDIQAQKSLYSFFAYEFCILLGQLKFLPVDQYKNKRTELLKYKWLLDYTDNPKVRLVNIINKILGISLTEKMLNLFLKSK